MRTGLPAAALVVAIALMTGACSAVRPLSDEPTPGYLRFEVEPTDAEVYIDDDFRGKIDGWRGETIPVVPGAKRVELRAPGFMTQRFDIEVAAGEFLTLELRLERELEDLVLEPPTNSKRGRLR